MEQRLEPLLSNKQTTVLILGYMYCRDQRISLEQELRERGLISNQYALQESIFDTQTMVILWEIFQDHFRSQWHEKKKTQNPQK